jgi:hypothetical protein
VAGNMACMFKIQTRKAIIAKVFKKDLDGKGLN